MAVTTTLTLFVVLLFLHPIPTRQDGFPTLDKEADLRSALEVIRKEDEVTVKNNLPMKPASPKDRIKPFSVDDIIKCINADFSKSKDCQAADLYLNEVRLRFGYKTHGDGCSSDPELNQLLLAPPRDLSNQEYPDWQRRLVQANQSLCNPFKHLQCSMATEKCECREGLIWKEEPFKSSMALRNRERICIIDMERPCGDGVNSDNPGRPQIVRYFSIFSRVLGTLSNEGPDCGPGECSRGFYTQRQRVCAPKNWDNEVSGLNQYFDDLPRLGLGEKCSVEHHNRFNTFSADEQSPSGFLVKRKKNLEDLKKSGATGFCDLSELNTCGNSGICECMFPARQKSMTCVIDDKKYTQCDVTPQVSEIYQNNTWSEMTRRLLRNGLENLLKDCPTNFTCHVGQDINEKMEMYCTCENGHAGDTCGEKLTKFLMFVRVPSFPRDVEGIQKKRMIFNDLNRRAIEFEKLFKLRPGVPCHLKSESEAEMIIEKIQRLEKKGTVMTRADYEGLTQLINRQIINGIQLCRRFDAQPLMCNMKIAECETEDVTNILERCNYLADIMCHAKQIKVQDGKCVCDFEIVVSPSPTPSSQTDNETSDARPAETTYYSNVFLIIIVLFVFN